jgi:hypothetical protein
MLDIIELREELREERQESKAGKLVNCSLADKKNGTPKYGRCNMLCKSPEGDAVGDIDFALYKIQKACPPPRSECPLSLDARLTGFTIFGIGLGSANVVPGSCVYGKVQ